MDLNYILVLFWLLSYLLVELTNSRCVIFPFKCSSIATYLLTGWKNLLPDNIYFIFYHYNNYRENQDNAILLWMTFWEGIMTEGTFSDAGHHLQADSSTLTPKSWLPCCCVLGNSGVKNVSCFEGWHTHRSYFFHSEVMKSEGDVQSLFTKEQLWNTLLLRFPTVCDFYADNQLKRMVKIKEKLIVIFSPYFLLIHLITVSVFIMLF